MKSSPNTNIDEILQAVATKAYNDKKADSLLPSIILGKELTPAQAKTQLEALLSAAKIESRIKALTDVDNLNLLNDSDAWHEFYIKELESYQESQ